MIGDEQPGMMMNGMYYPFPFGIEDNTDDELGILKDLRIAIWGGGEGGHHFDRSENYQVRLAVMVFDEAASIPLINVLSYYFDGKHEGDVVAIIALAKLVGDIGALIATLQKRVEAREQAIRDRLRSTPSSPKQPEQTPETSL